MKEVHYLVDTDWVIHYLNGHPQIVERIRSVRKEGLAISVISLAELHEGVYYSTDPTGNERALNEFLTAVSVLGVEAEVCKVFGKERGKLRHTKRLVDDFGLMIACTCLRWNLTLLTNNRSHFEVVDNLKIISVP